MVSFFIIYFNPEVKQSITGSGMHVCSIMTLFMIANQSMMGEGMIFVVIQSGFILFSIIYLFIFILLLFNMDDILSLRPNIH